MKPLDVKKELKNVATYGSGGQIEPNSCDEPERDFTVNL